MNFSFLISKSKEFSFYHIKPKGNDISSVQRAMEMDLCEYNSNKVEVKEVVYRRWEWLTNNGLTVPYCIDGWPIKNNRLDYLGNNRPP